ncbi:BREX-1 system adenine-specific DNA-methyltransferase PglX [Deltaproteobacteria bacterium TL4]
MLTEFTRKKLNETVDRIRERLLGDLYGAVDRKFSFSIKDRSRLRLSQEHQYQYQLLKQWGEDDIRKHNGFESNIRLAVREAAYTLVNRLFILKQLESRKLQPLAVLTGGKESEGYRSFREFCPQLCKGDDSGYGFLLKQLFDRIALELPGFFSNTGIQHIFDIPGPTLFWLIEQLDQKELEGAWSDDTTLGWLYQYWNDPDRTAVNNKILGKGVSKGKVETHEIAQATQLFTERYMVEWLLQNSLGTQWLAICKKNKWPSTTESTTLKQLEARRKEWRGKIEKGEVSQDMPMPLESGEEERWKFYIDQTIPQEVIDAAPKSLKEVKLLDPACGSGHFLVYAFDLLFHFYQEEASFKGKPVSNESIVQSILENNLHGIDIDPRAVQLAAASLLIKAKQQAPALQLSKLNLVATDLGLANLPSDDPSIQVFIQTLQNEVDLDPSQSLKIIEALKGADYLGSLLPIQEYLEKLNEDAPLFKFGADQAEKNLSLQAHQVITQALHQFMLTHDQGEDLGIKTRAEQLAKGIRLLELLSQKYHVVCANPPYLSKSKCQNDILDIFKRGSELYEEFFYRFITLTKVNGFIATLTAQNFMFISKFEELRKTLLSETLVYRCLHFGSDTFQDVLNALGFAAFVTIHNPSINVESEYIRLERIPMKLKSRHALNPPANRKFTFLQSKFKDLEGWPMIYWWPEEFREVYLKSPKLKDVGETRLGMRTGINSRFLKQWWEIGMNSISLIPQINKDIVDFKKRWVPYVKGAKGRRWFDNPDEFILWKENGLEIKIHNMNLYGTYSRTIQSRDKYFKQGIAFSYIGTSGFLCRLRKYQSVFDVSGSSIFVDNPEKTQVLLSSIVSGYVSQSINPTINNQVGDIDYLPVFDIIPNWEIHYDEAKALYEVYFSSRETCIEYTYQPCDLEQFEKAEILIRSDIDKEIYGQFKAETVKAIQEEVGESCGNYKKLTDEALDQASKLYPQFADTYLNGPLSYELGQLQKKADGTPERGKLQNLEELCHEFQLHPESILALRKKLGIQRKSDRQDEAYRHLAWALGVALGRFDAQTGGLIDLAAERRVEQNLVADPQAPKSLPHGLFFLSARGQVEEEPVIHPSKNAGLIQTLQHILTYKHGQDKSQALWQEIEKALVYDAKGSLTHSEKQKLNFNQFLREKCFEFHKSVYENRPIYFPLSSKKKSYVVWCNIHSWTDSTLKTILAEFLMPEKKSLSMKLEEMRLKKVRLTDKRELQDLEKRIDAYDLWESELDAFIEIMAQIAEKGANPAAQEATAPYIMDLDDGVMINSAALWPLLEPQWKDPKTWWGHLEKPVGKNDYDWSHLAMRYWPHRVWKKLEEDPSLAVAHSHYGSYQDRDLFKELHPKMAEKWDNEQ